MLHHVYRLVQGGRLHVAPISNPQRVLDMGTGTGLWALDFAELVQFQGRQQTIITHAYIVTFQKQK
jgi:ubiquinone/menaquinone biosynthesis C-methylase UbiE